MRGTMGPSPKLLLSVMGRLRRGPGFVLLVAPFGGGRTVTPGSTRYAARLDGHWRAGVALLAIWVACWLRARRRGQPWPRRMVAAMLLYRRRRVAILMLGDGACGCSASRSGRWSGSHGARRLVRRGPVEAKPPRGAVLSEISSYNSMSRTPSDP